MRDVDLLGLEMDLLWGTDALGRAEPAPLLAAGFAGDGRVARAGTEVPAGLASQLGRDAGLPDGGAAGGRRPADLDRWTELLAPVAAVAVTGGPSYLVGSPRAAPSAAKVLTSAQPVPASLRDRRPRAWWEPQEWTDLLTGRLGPWAIAVDGSSVVALCHTPRSANGAAEAGVWTHPDARRRGHAAAVTAAWAGVAARDHDLLFYSTAEHNLASQGVARALGLRPLGWIWQLRPDAVPGTDDREPQLPAG